MEANDNAIEVFESGMIMSRLNGEKDTWLASIAVYGCILHYSLMRKLEYHNLSKKIESHEAVFVV